MACNSESWWRRCRPRNDPSSAIARPSISSETRLKDRVSVWLFWNRRTAGWPRTRRPQGRVAGGVGGEGRCVRAAPAGLVGARRAERHPPGIAALVQPMRDRIAVVPEAIPSYSPGHAVRYRPPELIAIFPVSSTRRSRHPPSPRWIEGQEPAEAACRCAPFGCP